MIMITLLTFLYFIFFIYRDCNDSGVDIRSGYQDCCLLLQCRNLKTKVSVGEIYAFEGVLSRYSKSRTLGIFVTALKNGYSFHALQRAKSSPFHLLLTNVDDMCDDIRAYKFEEMKTEFIQKNLQQLEKRIITINKKMTTIIKKYEKMEEVTAMMIRRKMEDDINDIKNDYNFKIIVVTLIFLLIVFYLCKFN